MPILNIATYSLTLLLLLAQAALALRGIFDPAAGALGFGPAADSKAAEFYHAVYRDRNLVISAIGILLLVFGMWRALEIVFTVGITLPLYDIIALKMAGVPVLPVHYITLVVLIVLAGLIIARAIQAPV
ncbi:DUF4267 domain-containing protein [Sphingobium terrigena]|uniref:DUF4267 domain-containing protein n=1 Tax=Sphingobium terrigena TaxID=2304063 RepID=A0A418YUP8_9SPHN|nr:DUF4267 domain-containing protein [Sphingobium terrigena]RJG55893.1 DUF4267 domain-containing protein [Sphingobium terrigena]